MTMQTTRDKAAGASRQDLVHEGFRSTDTIHHGRAVDRKRARTGIDLARERLIDADRDEPADRLV